MRRCAVLILWICSSCALFGVGERHTVTGSFAATRRTTDGAGAGTCSASVDGTPAPQGHVTATWGWTSSFMGRADLRAFEMLCSLDSTADGGYLQITIPNLPPNGRLEQRTFSFILLEHGSWSGASDPSVAWLVGKLPPLTTGYLSSRSGTLSITQADSVTVAGTFSVSTRHEWSF
jgi:hypothetical protein